MAEEGKAEGMEDEVKTSSGQASETQSTLPDVVDTSAGQTIGGQFVSKTELKPLALSEIADPQGELKKAITENGIGERTEIPTPNSEQMTALWLSLHNISKAPGLKDFFDQNKPFPVDPTNYGNYAKTFSEYFGVMRDVLAGKKLSELGFDWVKDDGEITASEAQPEPPKPPFFHEIQYQSTRKTEAPKIPPPNISEDSVK